ncbi:MAG TPA: hypothetical protein VLG50_08335 [Candidatus Saccharimonadales bacterium]|nr:hypothetical protein [Candidatus Saccharimonadales bacterium]
MDQVTPLKLVNEFDNDSTYKSPYILNCHIVYKRKPDILSNSDAVKYFNQMYLAKMELAKRDIVIHITDDDLLLLTKHESILNLQLIPYISSNTTNNTTKIKVKSNPSSARGSPKSSTKNINKSKTEDSKITLSKCIHINDINYMIQYRNSITTFDFFKLTWVNNNNNILNCYGLLKQFHSKDYINDKYKVREICYNNKIYTFIYDTSHPLSFPTFIVLNQFTMTVSDLLLVLQLCSSELLL